MAFILAVNVGSSSLKFALFTDGDHPERQASGQIARIGHEGSSWSVKHSNGTGESRAVVAADHRVAAGLVLDWIESTIGPEAITSVGHRIVHGGPHHFDPEPITPALLDDLRAITPLDPDHMERELVVIEAFRDRLPDRSHVACFDTAFHRDMPREAQMIAIPRRYEAAGVRRYGFHGLSYASLMEELERVAGQSQSRGRVILAHLGAGASLAAVRGGTCVDTTMAFTPAAGLVMGTRAGDIDPGLVRFLMTREGLSPEAFDMMVNHQSGMLGVSETSGDVRDLLARESTDVRAAEAVNLFCYQARKAIGAYAAALAGLDTLVFAGGIGENSPEVRARICEDLRFLGVVLDDARNRASSSIISSNDASVTVRVIVTDEEIQIARSVARLAR